MSMTVEAALRDLAASDPRARARAAERLGSTDDPRAESALLRSADDPVGPVRYAALLSLSELGPTTLEAVTSATARLDDGEQPCREAAAIALGSIGQAAALAPSSASTKEVQAKAWEALAGAFEGPRPELRFQAVASLAELNLVAALPYVERALADPDAKIRTQAAAILGDSFGEDLTASTTQPLPDAPSWVTTALLRLTGDSTVEVSREAALSLARLGDPAAIPTLVSMVARGREVALDAATALAIVARRHRQRTPLPADELAGRLGRFRADPLVQVRLAEALAWQGDGRARAHLERLSRTWLRGDARGLARDVLSGLDADR